MQFFWRASFLVAATTLVTVNAFGSWVPGGNPLGRGFGFQVAASGPDRVIVAWIAFTDVNRQISSEQVRARAFTLDGDIAPGWPTEGALVTSSPGVTLSDFTLAGDGAGGAFIAWGYDDFHDARLQHVSASGAPAPGWAADGISLGAGYRGPLTTDGADGVLAARRSISPNRQNVTLIVDHIDAQAKPAAGWPLAGLQFPGAWDGALLVDSSHHVLVSTAEVDTATRKPLGIVVRRFDENGAPDPAWPENGVVIDEPNYTHGTWISPDGFGGAYVEWNVSRGYPCEYLCPYDPERSVVRVLNDGTKGSWSSVPKGTSSALDGIGGVLIGVQNHGRPGAIRLDGQGSVAPGWEPDGSPAMTEIVRSPGIVVTNDGSGGAFLAWWDQRGGDYHLYASRLDASGRLAKGWPETGTVIGPRVQSRYLETSLSVALASLAGVAVAVWTEYPGPLGFVTALRPGEPGPVADLAPIDRPVGFGVVQLRTNPAKGSIVAIVELPGVEPARLELLDAAGRSLERREFSFPQQARGSVRFDERGRLPAGIYWLRLTQAGRVASKKVVLLQ